VQKLSRKLSRCKRTDGLCHGRILCRVCPPSSQSKRVLGDVAKCSQHRGRCRRRGRDSSAMVTVPASRRPGAWQSTSKHFKKGSSHFGRPVPTHPPGHPAPSPAGLRRVMAVFREQILSATGPVVSQLGSARYCRLNFRAVAGSRTFLNCFLMGGFCVLVLILPRFGR
jgi:hypothetical protein